MSSLNLEPIASLSYLDFKPKGYIPKKAIEKFKEEHKDCVVLEKKDGRYTIGLQALRIGGNKI